MFWLCGSVGVFLAVWVRFWLCGCALDVLWCALTVWEYGCVLAGMSVLPGIGKRGHVYQYEDGRNFLGPTFIETKNKTIK